jgi:pyridoxal phosphate enzyme (YggS family)
MPREAGFPVADGLRSVRSAIAAAASRAGRDPSVIDLVAVSKTQPAERIEEAIAAGQRAFGENRVQEAAAKFPAVKARHLAIRLHLIGPLQTNKAREAVRLFEAIESLDRPRLAEALAAAMDKEGRRPDCFVQVNTGEEPQKAGVAPKEADALIAEARGRWGLPVVGLMCIPPLDEEPALHFALLAKIARRNNLERLSMGMSGDFETAIRLGATELRIGTAIFGERRPAGEVR